jgi:hypothetical protein
MIFPHLVMDILQDPGYLCRGTFHTRLRFFVYIQKFLLAIRVAYSGRYPRGIPTIFGGFLIYPVDIT